MPAPALKSHLSRIAEEARKRGEVEVVLDKPVVAWERGSVMQFAEL